MSRSEFDELARAALERYDVGRRARLTFVRHGENATFRVTDRGHSFALRLARPGYHTLVAIRSEIAWMDALRASRIATPRPVPGGDGETVQPVSFRGHDQTVVAFEWVTGVPLPETKAEDPWARLGEIMARVHRHGREWAPPSWFERPAWDLEALVGDAPRWGDPCPGDVWSRVDRKVLLAARDAVRERLATLGTAPDRFGLIHSDLGFENVLVASDGSTTVIDFDDCGPSWYLYELASVLYPLEDDNRFGVLRDALVMGYRREGELTDAHLAELPTFLMCRRLATLGWTFSRSETEHARRQRAKRLRTSPTAARRFLEWSAAGGDTAAP
jgi:Ser/Thr protein kinase RdoA (MazF antagonist)